MPKPKSFYDLVFAVDPGGARKDAHFIRGSLDEIREDLAAELGVGMNLYLLCWYGAHLRLDVYQRGQRAKSIDLHPYVRIDIDGYPQITFDSAGKALGSDFRGDPDDPNSLTARMFEDRLGDAVRVSVAWDRIEAPPLRSPVAKDGDLVTLEGDWREDDDEDELDEDELRDDGWLPYGMTDLEE